jgi:hypothetical protein
LKQIRQADVPSEVLPRRKLIIIEDSGMSYNGLFEKTSRVLSAKSPFKKDEWNEQNGLDLNKPQGDENEDDEVEKMLQEESEEEGFIVSDGYLSASEFGLS